jgi:dolichol-phosphate mannosyltransferase
MQNTLNDFRILFQQQITFFFQVVDLVIPSAFHVKGIVITQWVTSCSFGANKKLSGGSGRFCPKNMRNSSSKTTFSVLQAILEFFCNSSKNKFKSVSSPFCPFSCLCKQQIVCWPNLDKVDLEKDLHFLKSVGQTRMHKEREEKGVEREQKKDSALKTRMRPEISVIVPTYREAANLPLLIERLGRLRGKNQLDLELLIIDDDSRDGTEELIEGLGLNWIRLFTRKSDRGLSRAVCEGLKHARGNVIVVMDADLSHPPESIPELVQALVTGHDFAIGSRYVEGGTTAEDWGAFRRINSRIATLLAMPFTKVKDPMSGFFAIKRCSYESVAHCLDPIGYKIGLELIVKCDCERVKEVPIHFCDRRAGESKLTLSEQANYIKHIRRLFIHKYGAWSNLVQFLAVGALGAVVNLGLLTFFIALGVGVKVSIAAAIAISMVSNFALNRRFTFSHARKDSIVKQFCGYIGACSLGALLNYFVTAELSAKFPRIYPQVAALAGIGAGVSLNFLINQFIVFRSQATDATSNPELVSGVGTHKFDDIVH